MIAVAMDMRTERRKTYSMQGRSGPSINTKMTGKLLCCCKVGHACLQDFRSWLTVGNAISACQQTREGLFFYIAHERP